MSHLQAVLRTDLQHPGRKLKDDSQILHSCVRKTDIMSLTAPKNE